VSRSDSRRAVTSHWRIVTTIACVLFVLCTWALASPPGSSPDDEFHLASIWCAAGATSDICEDTTNPDVILLPRLIALDGAEKPCFVFQAQTSGSCLFDGAPNALTPHSASRTNSGLYPPVYYAAMHTLVTRHTLASATAMRIANVLIAVALLFATLAIARPSVRRSLAVAAVATSVPLGLFIVASVNPSSWTFAGCLVAWAALLAFGQAQTRHTQWAAAAIYLIGSAMAVAARADGLAYIGVITVAAPLASTELRQWLWRHRIVVAAVIGAGVALIAIVLIRVGQAQVAFGKEGTFQEGDLATAVPERLVRVIVELPGYLAGAFGTWPVGQLDAPVPTIVWFLGIGVFVSLLMIGLGRPLPGKGWAVALIAAAFFLIPLFILVRGGLYVGQAIQPRYLLPLLPAMVGFALLTRDPDGGIRLTSAQRWLAIVATTIAQSVALHWVLRRYITGSDIASWNLNYNVEWWWSWMPSPLVTWAIASLAFGYVAYRAFALCASSRTRPAASHASPTPDPILSTK
jgi:hypothetical protein